MARNKQRPRTPPSRRDQAPARRARDESDYIVAADPRDDPEKVARHEAGHAVAAAVMGLDLQYVDILPRQPPDDETLGVTLVNGVGSRVVGKGAAAAIPVLAYIIAGPEASLQRWPELDGSAAFDGDREHLDRLAFSAVCKPSIGPDGGIFYGQAEIEKHRPVVEEMTAEAARKARAILRDHGAALDRVSAALLERGKLTGKEVAAIVAECRPATPAGDAAP